MQKKAQVKRRGRGPIVLYHRTTSARWRRIRAEGFRNGKGTYGMDAEVCGVWLSDRPLDMHEGAFGDVLLSVELDAPRASLRRFEVREPGKPYREFIVPADLLNSRARVCRFRDDAVWPEP
jgi:hypothetical protein